MCRQLCRQSSHQLFQQENVDAILVSFPSKRRKLERSAQKYPPRKQVEHQMHTLKGKRVVIQSIADSKFSDNNDNKTLMKTRWHIYGINKTKNLDQHQFLCVLSHCKRWLTRVLAVSNWRIKIINKTVLNSHAHRKMWNIKKTAHLYLSFYCL